jgi:hypothetical protein
MNCQSLPFILTDGEPATAPSGLASPDASLLSTMFGRLNLDEPACKMIPPSMNSIVTTLVSILATSDLRIAQST